MITLRFVSHPGPFSLACQFAQYGYWPSHCEAVMPDGSYLGSRFIGGVQPRPHDYDAGGFSREMFVELPATAEQRQRFFSFLRDQIDKPYDWRAIIAFYSIRQSRDWREDDSWFCSELIAAALTACGKFPEHLAVKFSRITPRDLVLLSGVLAEGGTHDISR